MGHKAWIAAIGLAALLAGCGAPPPRNSHDLSDQQLAKARQELKNPVARRDFLAMCQARTMKKSAKDRNTMAVIMKVPPAKTAVTFCNRMTRGLETGQLDADDFATMQQGTITPAILAVLQAD